MPGHKKPTDTDVDDSTAIVVPAAEQPRATRAEMYEKTLLVHRLRRAGLTCVAIAAELGCCEKTVRRHLATRRRLAARTLRLNIERDVASDLSDE